MSRLSLALVLVVAATGTLGVAGARAEQVPAVSGTFTMTSEPGDYIGDGQTYSYEADTLDFGGGPSGLVIVSVRGGGNAFSVRLSAPAGEEISERAYEGAVRFPDASQPLLDVSGDGRACNETFGSFTVHNVEYGLHGYLRSLHVTFEQHCGEATAPALRGEVDVAAAPPPAPLELDLTFDADRTNLDPATGFYHLHGSIECSQEVEATVIVDVREVGRETNGAGDYQQGVECSPTATDWVVVVASRNNIAFTPGALDAELQGVAADEYYTDFTGDSVYARDEASGRSEVGASGVDVDSDVVADDDGGLTGFVARDPVAAVLIGIGMLIAAVLATAVLTLLVARRRYRPPTRKAAEAEADRG